MGSHPSERDEAYASPTDVGGGSASVRGVEDVFGQRAHRVRMDWGPVGARAAGAEVAVVVDVLSFSTSVAVAVERGIEVLPYRWRDDGAAAYAERHGAVLAVGRLEAARSGAVPAPSLSPATLRTCAAVPRLVLPSPNGSTIAAALDEAGARVVVGCLRNATAVARWLLPHLTAGRSVVVVAAGERWSQDDSLRPALEDQLGAGAVLAALQDLTDHDGAGVDLSPEARAASALFRSCRDEVADVVRACVGGRELVAKGYTEDADVAGEHDASTVVPVLLDGAFRAVSSSEDRS